MFGKRDFMVAVGTASAMGVLATSIAAIMRHYRKGSLVGYSLEVDELIDKADEVFSPLHEQYDIAQQYRGNEYLDNIEVMDLLDLINDAERKMFCEFKIGMGRLDVGGMSIDKAKEWLPKITAEMQDLEGRLRELNNFLHTAVAEREKAAEADRTREVEQRVKEEVEKTKKECAEKLEKALKDNGTSRKPRKTKTETADTKADEKNEATDVKETAEVPVKKPIRPRKTKANAEASNVTTKEANKED